MVKKIVGAGNAPTKGLVKATKTRNDFTTIGGKLDYALLFYYQGVHIAPCQPRSKAYLTGYGPRKKHITDDLHLAQLLEHRPYNYALLTGTGREGKRLVVIDFDDPQAFEAWKREAGSLADTFTVKTRRGFHVYYWLADTRSWRGAGFEVMGRGKAVMGPRSVHPSGAIYTPQNRPWLRQLESLVEFPLLRYSPPELPAAPAVRPDHLGGGVVARIKRDISIISVIEGRPDLAGHIRLKSSDGGRGRWYAGFCPFHADRRKRSFWIDAQRNLYGCHACDARGDVINFVAWAEALTNREAIDALAKDLK